MGASELSSVPSRRAGIAALVAPAPPAAPEPFGDETAGFDYFRTDYHHRHLAAAVAEQFVRGCGFVLVTGEPGADGELIERFLDGEREKGYRASLVCGQAGMDFSDLVRAYGRRLGLAFEGDSSGLWSLLSRLMLEARNRITRVLVIDHAEALDARCFDELLRFTRLDDPYPMPVVLLASPAFVGQLAAPPFDTLGAAIAGRLVQSRLAVEEVGAFIQFQLNAIGKSVRALFPPEIVAAIAQAANGDPAIVNRLARQVMKAAVECAEAEAREKPSTVKAAAAPAATEPLGVTSVSDERAPIESGAEAPTGARPAIAAQGKWRLARSTPWIVAVFYVIGTLISGVALIYFLGPRMLHHGARPELATAPSPETGRPLAATNPAPTMEEGPTAKLVDAATEPSAIETRNPLLSPTQPPAALETPGLDPGSAAPPARAGPTPPSEAAVKSAVASDAPSPVDPGAAATPAPITAPPAEAASHVAPSSEVQPERDATVIASPDNTVTTPPAIAPAGASAPGSVPISEPMQSAAPVRPTSEAASIVNGEIAVTTPVAPLPPASEPLSHAELAMLVQRGEQFLAAGDIAAARGFFERAADAGDAQAACGLGKTFDPAYLWQIGVRGLSGNRALAISWYRKAKGAGSTEAAARLERLLAVQSP